MNWLHKTLLRLADTIYSRYEGATFNPQRSYIPAGYHSVRYDTTAHSRSEMARKMRYFERNNSLCQALSGKYENFVVGASPQLCPNSSDPEWNKYAKEWWEIWSQVCDLTSHQSFGTLLQLAARRWQIEGDAFFLLTQGRESRGSRPRVQLIEGHLCRTPDEYADDPRVHDGVRMDEFGRPTDYYFAEEIRPGEFEFGPPRDANAVVPVMEPERPGEVRCVTQYHACINELHDLDDLHILEMQAARDNAAIKDWIETSAGELTPEQLRRSRFNTGTVLSTGATASIEKLQYYRDAGGARTQVLQRGDKIHQHAGERPSIVTRDYWRLKTELVCAAVEIPYCIVFPDSMQGTVYRGALDMAATAFKSRHTVMADVQRRIWSYVMGWATKVDPKLADPPADWFKVTVQPPRAPNVDVGRNSAAMLEELRHGATNYDLIYGPQGLDWRVELQKLNEQLIFIKGECPDVYELLNANLMEKMLGQQVNPQLANKPAPKEDDEEVTPYA